MRSHRGILVAIAGCFAYQAIAQSGASGLTLHLTSDRSVYYVGEPIRLTLTARNGGTSGVAAYVTISGEESDLRFRRGAESFRSVFRRPDVTSVSRSRPRGPIVDLLRAPSVLPPQGIRVSEVVLAAKSAAGEALFDEPGEYQFQVRCRPEYDGADQAVLVSDTVSVTVKASEGDARALRDYLSSGMPAFVQAAVGASRADSTVLQRAAAFIERHPNGRYAGYVRVALKEALASKIQHGDATVEERALYEQITGSGGDN